MNLFEAKLVRSIWLSLGFKSVWKSVLFSDLTQLIVLETRADPWRFLLKRKERFVKSATIFSNNIITFKFLSL